jgi:hypothetical protein
MKFDKEEKYFIKANEKKLRSLFNKRIEELKELICSMPGSTPEEREKRDRQHLLLAEFRGWVKSIDRNCSKSKEDENPNCI